MEAKDLRIGNYVHIDLSIDDIEVVKLKIGDLASFAIGHRDLFPIPITEDWLIKLGFERLSDRIYINGDIGYDFGINKGAVLKRNECFLMFNNIQKVHELQNFYFAITGKELETNEN